MFLIALAAGVRTPPTPLRGLRRVGLPERPGGRIGQDAPNPAQGIETGYRTGAPPTGRLSSGRPQPRSGD